MKCNACFASVLFSYKFLESVVRNVRGSNTSPEIIAQIMTVWASNNNMNATARQLGIPEATVRKIVKANKDKEEYTKLCAEKREEFSQKASRIIDKALKRLEDDIELKDDIPVNHLTIVIGTLVDKKLLIEGKPTNRTEVIGSEKLSKLAELAGYERRE